jgi:ABC-type uncharacterized transport system permease subunit
MYFEVYAVFGAYLIPEENQESESAIRPQAHYSSLLGFCSILVALIACQSPAKLFCKRGLFGAFVSASSRLPSQFLKKSVNIQRN